MSSSKSWGWRDFSPTVIEMSRHGCGSRPDLAKAYAVAMQPVEPGRTWPPLGRSSRSGGTLQHIRAWFPCWSICRTQWHRLRKCPRRQRKADMQIASSPTAVSRTFRIPARTHDKAGCIPPSWPDRVRGSLRRTLNTGVHIASILRYTVL